MKEKGKMVPNHISKAFAIGSLVVPMASHAFAVGDIDVRSFLNQKLKAELSINLNNDERVIGVTLASSEKYKQQGILWQPYLSDLRLNLKEVNNNKAIVEITSQTGMNEPMLDILVEIKIGNGAYYEEVAIVLDPLDESTLVVKAVNREVVPKAVKSATTKRVEKTVETGNGDTAHADIKLSGDVYGPVAANETLSSIARKLSKTVGASPKQVMFALFEGNRDAFYKNNINYLKASSHLKLPSDYQSVSKDQAEQWFSAQMGNKASAAPVLKLEAPVQDHVAKAIEDAKKRVENGKQGSASVNLADENAIRMQIASIEHEILRTQELLKLKQTELNAIGNPINANGTDKNVEIKQGNIDVKPVDVKAVDVKPGDVVSVPSTNVTPVDVKPVDVKPVEVKPVEQINNQTVEVKPVDPTANPVDIKPVETKPVDTKPEEVKPVEVKPVTPVTPVAPVTPVVVPTVVNSDEIPAYIYGIAGTGVAVLIAMLLWRRKRLNDMDAEFAANQEDHIEEASNLLIVDDSSDNLAPNFNSSSSIDYKLAEDSSFLQDFTNTDFAEFDSGDNDTDAMTEADVYIAYARYDHAESLIKESILENPDNDKLKLKLFEVYHISNNSDKFEKFAKELKAQGKHNDFNFWPKVLKMGKEVCPESPLFNLEKEEEAEKIEQPREPINLFKSLESDLMDEDDEITFESLGKNNSDIDFTKEKVKEAAIMFGVDFSLDEPKSVYNKDEATSAISEAVSMFSLGKSIDDIVDNLDEIDFKGGDSHTINFESNLLIDTTFADLDDEK